MIKEWYETHENLVLLASALDGDVRFNETADVIRFFEKPWKWTPEWERWEAAGKPAKFDFDEPEPNFPDDVRVDPR